MALTDKKRRFVDALLSGATNREAAIAAGYSEKTASQAGSKLAKDPDVLAEVGRRLKQKQEASVEVKPGRKVKGDDPAQDEQGDVVLTHTDDPRAFLTELMNADGADLRMRLEAAKTLMPYLHGKVADQGKKEQKAEAAKEAGKGKYSQGKPPAGKPSLSMVKGYPVSPEHMLHFKLFSLDGIVGLSPIEHQAETMGLAKAGQQWSARFMRKGGFTGGYVIYEQFLTKAQQAQVMEKFPDVRKADADDIGKMAILQGNPKIVPAGISQKDAQFIESQQFQEEALAGIYGVPLWLANRAGKTSIMGSNLEQQLTGYITFGLKPFIDAVEDEFNDKLYRSGTRFSEFAVEGLLRADSAGRATYYGSALGGSGGSGWMTINEVRVKENLPPLEGDEYNRVTRWEMEKNGKP